MTRLEIDIQQAWTAALREASVREASERSNVTDPVARARWLEAIRLDDAAGILGAPGIRQRPKIDPDRQLRIQLAWSVYHDQIKKVLAQRQRGEWDENVLRKTLENYAASAIMHADLLITVHDRVRDIK